MLNILPDPTRNREMLLCFVEVNWPVDTNNYKVLYKYPLSSQKQQLLFCQWVAVNAMLFTTIPVPLSLVIDYSMHTNTHTPFHIYFYTVQSCLCSCLQYTIISLQSVFTVLPTRDKDINRGININNTQDHCSY